MELITPIDGLKKIDKIGFHYILFHSYKWILFVGVFFFGGGRTWRIWNFMTMMPWIPWDEKFCEGGSCWLSGWQVAGVLHHKMWSYFDIEDDVDMINVDIYLEPQTTIYKLMFGETTIFYVMIWNHPIEISIYNWLFGDVWGSRYNLLVNCSYSLNLVDKGERLTLYYFLVGVEMS